MQYPWSEKINTIDLKALERSLEGDIPVDSVRELKGFGQFLLGAAEQRTEQIKNRGVSVIGWALVSLAFLLRGQDGKQPLLIALAGVFALAAIVLGITVAWRKKRSSLSLPVWFWANPKSDDFSNLQKTQMLVP